MASAGAGGGAGPPAPQPTKVIANAGGVPGLFLLLNVFNEEYEQRLWHLAPPLTATQRAKSLHRFSKRVVIGRHNLPFYSSGDAAEMAVWGTITELVNAVKDVAWDDMFLPDYIFMQVRVSSSGG